MKLKPSKCRSFSLKSGKPSIVPFSIEDHPVPSIAVEEQKFLGRVLFFDGKSQECFDLLKQKLQEKIENLDKTEIRPEFKLEIYKIYILPSVRFLLTVHDLPKSHLLKLDTFTDQYLKKWAGLPRCATTSLLHLDTSLGIKQISTLYLETHTVTHCSVRLKGDARVNHVLDNRLERESALIRKQSVTVEAERIYKRALNYNMVQGEIPTDSAELTLSEGPVLILPGVQTTPSHKFITEVKNEAKSQVTVSENEKMLAHVQTLVKQGKFLELTQVEKTDATWQSFIFNLPRGTMKFVLNAAIDTLPTKVNLKQWGKLVNDKCFCGRRQTLNHVLNCCNRSLEQGRFTFRHDAILSYIATCLDRKKYECYVDIQGHQTPGGGTFPPSLVVTTLKPDIVIVDKKQKATYIFELTVPSEGRLEQAHKLKQAKYEHFKTDISSHKVSVIPFEIGSHTGYINRENKANLHSLHKFCKSDIKLKKFKENVSAIAILGSYYIFNCRNDEAWESSDPILPPFSNQ